MIFKSKFDIGDVVYYWSNKKIKALRGEICSISLSKLKDNEEQWNYSIIPTLDEDKPFSICEMVSESLVFKERDDVFDFCMKLTEGI